MSLSRLKNVAGASDVAKVLRSHMRHLDVAHFSVSDLDKVVANFEEVLVDVLQVTPRPTQNLFKDAALDAFRCDADEALLFGQRLSAAVHHCRIKLKGSTTGERLAPSTRVICKAMLKADGVSPTKGLLSEAKEKPVKRFTSPLKKGAREVEDDLFSAKKVSTGNLLHTADDVRALYGMSSSSMPKSSPISSPLVMEIGSSQETEDLEMPGSSSSSKDAVPQNLVQYEDAAKACLVRLVNGSRVEALMKPGPNGFALGFFGAECFQTEIPNLIIDKKTTAPAKVVRKRPAARKPAAKADSEAKNDSQRKDDVGSNSDSDVPSTKEYASPRQSEGEAETPTPEQIRGDYGLELVKPKSQMHNGGKLAITIVALKGYITWNGKCWVNLTNSQASSAGKRHGDVLIQTFNNILSKSLCSKEEVVAERDAILQA